MGYGHRHIHGSVTVGRTIVAVGLLPLLWANWIIFEQALVTPYPMPGMEQMMVISVLWIIVSATALGLRKSWGRYLLLTILYASAFGFFITGVITLATGEAPLAARLKPMMIGTVFYLIVSLVLTHSKHVKRLTSRTWE